MLESLENLVDSFCDHMAVAISVILLDIDFLFMYKNFQGAYIF